MKRLIAALLLALILTGAVAAQDPTPDPLRPFTLDALRARDYAGGAIVVGDVLETTPSYTHRAFSYSSDGLTVTGVMNVPNGRFRCSSCFTAITTVPRTGRAWERGRKQTSSRGRDF